jgi:hypothetical protein
VLTAIGSSLAAWLGFTVGTVRAAHSTVVKAEGSNKKVIYSFTVEWQLHTPDAAHIQKFCILLTRCVGAFAVILILKNDCSSMQQ